MRRTKQTSARRGTVRALVRLLPLLFGIIAAAGAEEEARTLPSLEFLEGQSCEVVDNVYEDIRAVAISERTFDAKLVSVGKAPPLSSPILGSLRAKDRALYEKAKAIESAVKLEQNKKQFYLRIFNPLPLLDEIKGNQVKCRVVMLSIRTADGLVHIPIVKTLRAR